MRRYQLRIGGQAVDPLGSTWFETQNPYTGTTWAEIPRGDARDVDAAVQAAHRALTSAMGRDDRHPARGAHASSAT
jgi:aldehyde dehydrogenase (NAD+)